MNLGIRSAHTSQTAKAHTSAGMWFLLNYSSSLQLNFIHIVEGFETIILFVHRLKVAIAELGDVAVNIIF